MPARSTRSIVAPSLSSGNAILPNPQSGEGCRARKEGREGIWLQKTAGQGWEATYDWQVYFKSNAFHHGSYEYE